MTLARAKQTTRADARRTDARRRYRQTLAQNTDLTEAEEGDEPQPRSASGAGRAAAPAQPGRPGIMSAFRGAYRPARYREDLAALPQLLRGRWFLISLAAVLGGYVAWVAAPSTLTLFLFQTLTYPPAMLPIFLVGFTAPRASYLLGLVVGLFDVALLFVGYGSGIAEPVSGTAVPIGDFLVNGLAFVLPASVLFAAGAAWYRRFLALSNAGRRPASSNRSKSASRSAARR